MVGTHSNEWKFEKRDRGLTGAMEVSDDDQFGEGRTCEGNLPEMESLGLGSPSFLDGTDSEFELVRPETQMVAPETFEKSDCEEILRVPLPQPVVTGSAWEHIMSQSFFSAVTASDALALPWETGPMRDIFNPVTLPSVAKVCGDATNLKDLKPEESVPVVGHADSTYAVGAMPAYMSAVKNLKDTDYMENKRAQKSLAVAKWMDLLSVCWSCSSVGAQLKSDLQLDPSGIEAEATLHSVFGVKSPTTLLKRAASLNQYLKWFAGRFSSASDRRSPLPLSETAVWSYFLHLRDSRMVNNKGFTISSTFLETVRFCKHVLGMDACDAILASKRLIGFAALEKQHKGPTRQAPPMEAEHLVELHRILEHGENHIDRIGAGCFLVATYARARWSDLRYVHHIKYDGYKRNATFDIYTAEHKTSSVGLRRQQFLPLVVPAEGIAGGNWLATWIELMKDSGCDWEKVPFGPLLPAPRGHSGSEWCARPLSTSEAAVWLRKLLEGLPRADELKAHSMKTTLCVWAARAGFTKEHRAILSHHSSALHGSDVVYSRDLQTGAILRLQMLPRKIRLGLEATSEADDGHRKITSAFDAGQTSSVRTPVLEPETAGLDATEGSKMKLGESLPEVVEIDAVNVQESSPEIPNMTEVKSEEDFESRCVGESNNFGPFTARELSSGMIELDSSSGSSSGQDDSDSDDSGLVDEALEGFKDHAFVGEVPAGESYFAHKKSGIMHRLQSMAETFVCKLKPGKFHFEVSRKFHVKYPKCRKCFPERHKGVDPWAEASAVLDRASKKKRSQ